MRLLLVPALLLSLACSGRDEGNHPVVPGGDPARGKRIVQAAGCGSCHTISGMREAKGLVGPPLQTFARRVYIAGQLQNTPDNLVRWLLDPHAVEPGTAMPDVGLSPEQARDVAAYLYTLR